MAILDHFRSLPGHKHPDPEVRLAHVEALSIDEREQLVSAAREDESARVRRAAVGKLIDPAVLGLIVRDDPDPGVRAQATSMLRDIALEAFEEPGEVERLAAIDAIADVKILSQVIKTVTRESVARHALARVDDPRVLGSIARHAALEPIRCAAFDALHEHEEILAVAMNSEFRDTAVAAVDRLAGRRDLEQVASQSNNRNAVKRARTILRELDERAAQQAATAAPTVAAALQPDQAGDAADAAAETSAARAVEAERAHAAAEAARRDAERRAAEHAAAQEAAAERKRKEGERIRARLLDLVAEIEGAAAEDDLRSAKRRLEIARREWKHLTASVPADADLAERSAAAQARIVARETESREADRRARRDGLNQMHQLLARVEPLTSKNDLPVKMTERALRDVRAVLAAVPPLPSKQDYDEVVRRLKEVQGALTPKLQELRDLEDWQRWANVGIQDQLCEKMDALKSAEDPEEIARRIRDLQLQWRQASDVPRAQGEALWQRFKAAHDEVWAKCEAHFAADAERRRESLAKKIALCERAEALADSTSWIQTADEIKRLQAEWKTIGPVSRGQEKSAWERFRAACDRFFSRRHEDLAQRKTMWAGNLAKKDALCARAEALADSTDWDAAAAEVKRLQAEWKTIGPVKKSRSDAIWQRFRGACDRFFMRFSQRHEIARGERAAAREAMCAELEAASAAAGSAGQGAVDAADTDTAAAGSASEQPPADLLAKVRTLRGRWQQDLALRGVDPERAAALDRRFAAAFDAVIARWPQVFAGTDLDPGANRARMDALVRRVETLASSLGGPAALASNEALSPTTRLASMLKEALAANTIGGKVDEESRWRAAQEDVRQAQASWSRIGPVSEETRRALADRFQRACRRILEGSGS